MILRALERRRQRALRHDFRTAARALRQQHQAQTAETVRRLNEKYARPGLGRMTVHEACGQLARCHDLSDGVLRNANQLTHVLQVIEGMERDGIADEGLLLAALIHDIGKILLLHGEAPENVIGINAPLGDAAPGIGLDRLVMQWNHDEFIYLRLRDHVPEDVAWLLRYHSIDLETTRPFMNARDLERLERLLVPFRKYDFGTKSADHLPARSLAQYRDFLDSHFPRPIDF